MQVRAPSPDNADARVERRRHADKDVLKLNGRIWLAPSASPRFEAELVPAQVEAGAGTKFEKAQRQAGLPCDSEKAAEERRRPADFVRLHVRTDEATKHAALMLEGREESFFRTAAIRVTTHRRIKGLENRRAA